jgi:hypothetical protein
MIAMTPEVLTSLLVDKLLGWRATSDRFLMANRQWLPRWRFQPTSDLGHAFRLLDAARPEDFIICGTKNHDYTVRVRIRGILGEAASKSIPLAICLATARALGAEVALCD